LVASIIIEDGTGDEKNRHPAAKVTGFGGGVSFALASRAQTGCGWASGLVARMIILRRL
jgi:hypothetical protein